MIKCGSIVKIIDNSGAKTAKCIKILKGFKKNSAFVGDFILVSIKDVRMQEFLVKKNYKIQKKNIFKGLVVNCKNYKINKTNIKYYYKDNCIILIDNKNNPIGNRILGYLPIIFKKQYVKIFNLSLKLL